MEIILGHLDFNILSTLKLNGFERNEIVTDTWLFAYGAHFVTTSDCAGAIGWAKRFAVGMHRFAAPDAAAMRAICALPALAIWDAADRTLQAKHFLPLFSAIFPHAPIHTIERAGHYSLEDAPGEITAIVKQFIQQA